MGHRKVAFAQRAGAISGDPKPAMFCFVFRILYSFNKYILYVYEVPGSVLGNGDRVMMRQMSSLSSWGFFSSPFQIPHFVGLHVLSPNCFKVAVTEFSIVCLAPLEWKAGNFCFSLKTSL